MSIKNLINMANTNRNKGHNYERQLVKDFKELGYFKVWIKDVG